MKLWSWENKEIFSRKNIISYVQNNSNRNKGEMDGWYVFNIIYPYVI